MERQEGECIQFSFTERAIVAGSERPYEVVDGGILVTTVVQYKISLAANSVRKLR